MSKNSGWSAPLVVGSSVLMGVSACLALEPQPDAATFMAVASKILPIEQPYDYHRALKEGPVHRPLRNSAVRVTSEEMSVAADGWRVLIHADAGPVVHFAAEDLRDYLHTSMQVRAAIEQRPALENWAEQKNAIVAGTPDQLPGIGETLKGPKDYEIRVSPDRIVVCGFDLRGVMFGLFNLEARMNLRQAPFLPRDLQTVRHSRYQTRMVMSWLGWMQWPDAYLSHLAHDGYDATYASVYANPNGVEGPPHYHLIRRQNVGRLNDLIRRAGRRGIKVYTPILFAYTGEPDSETALRKHVRDIVTKFPDIYGYILLTEGFFYKEFLKVSKLTDSELLEWARHWTRAVGIVEEECHRLNPAIEVLPWEYNIDFRPHRVDLKRQITSMMPRGTIPKLT